MLAHYMALLPVIYVQLSDISWHELYLSYHNINFYVTICYAASLYIVGLTILHTNLLYMLRGTGFPSMNCNVESGIFSYLWDQYNDEFLICKQIVPE